jgi:mersacidin/lichenicidin family type 2 lantibiotic
MNRPDIVRAWKDEEYRNSLTAVQRDALPQNPAGIVEINSAATETVAGGNLQVARTASPLVCGIQPTIVCSNGFGGGRKTVRSCYPPTVLPLQCAQVRPTLTCKVASLLCR